MGGYAEMRRQQEGIHGGAHSERCDSRNRYSMTDLWCIKSNVNDGETFVSADAAEISPHGELAFYRENGLSLPGPGLRARRLDVLLRRSSRWSGGGRARWRLRWPLGCNSVTDKPNALCGFATVCRPDTARIFSPAIFHNVLI